MRPNVYVRCAKPNHSSVNFPSSLRTTFLTSSLAYIPLYEHHGLRYNDLRYKEQNDYLLHHVNLQQHRHLTSHHHSTTKVFHYQWLFLGLVFKNDHLGQFEIWWWKYRSKQLLKYLPYVLYACWYMLHTTLKHLLFYFQCECKDMKAMWITYHRSSRNRA